MRVHAELSRFLCWNNACESVPRALASNENEISTRDSMKILESNHEKLKLKMIELFSKQQYLCVTFDVWTSFAVSFFGMTIHFLTESFERRSYALSFKPLYERQTHEQLANAMQNVFDEFKIEKSKITNVVTDGCSAFTKSFKRFGKEDPHTSSQTLEEIPLDDIVEENNNADYQLPFIQNENGEMFVHNILTFGHSVHT